MESVEAVVVPLKKFAKDSKNFLNKCTKPDKKEFKKIATGTAIGFLVVGFLGYFIKLIHIPINNILVGG